MASLSATLKGLLTSPVNPASCSCARGLAVALTELASVSPSLAALAAPAKSGGAGASCSRAPPPSLATWGPSKKGPPPPPPPSGENATVERLKAELAAPPPPPELAADGLASAHDELWRRRFAAALPP